MMICVFRRKESYREIPPKKEESLIGMSKRRGVAATSYGSKSLAAPGIYFGDLSENYSRIT